VRGITYALQAPGGSRERLTAGKAMPKLSAYQRRLTEMENWLNANRPELSVQAHAAGCRLPDAASVLRLMVSNSRNAECDLTTGQLAAKSLLSEAQVKRCLKALSAAGCWVQVLPGCSAGRHGGAGRGAVRRLTMVGLELQVPQADPTPAPSAAPEQVPQHGIMVQSGLNHGAVDCTPLRTLPTENNPSRFQHNAEREPAQVGGGGIENDEPSTPRTPAPDRRAFPNTASWCAAMAEHARANAQGPTAENEPQEAPTERPEPAVAHPMPDEPTMQRLAAVAGRRYAEQETALGRAHSGMGLAKWAAGKHLETLQALCRTHDHWRRWVLAAQFDTVALALHYWHADRTLHLALVDQLNREALERQQYRQAG